MTGKLGVTIQVVLSFVFLTTSVFSQNLATLIDIDKSLESEVTAYASPESLVLVPLDISQNTDTEEWYKGLLYFQTTRYGLPSVSFHYIITENGDVIENSYSKTDRAIFVDGFEGTSPLLVGYVKKTGDLSFSPRSEEKIISTVIDLVNQNAIPLDQIYIKDIGFSQSAERELRLSLSEPNVVWQQQEQEMMETVSQNYNPVERNYAVEVAAVNEPEQTLQVGQTFDLKIILKNTGDNPIYGGSTEEPLLTSTQVESSFFLNNEWETQSQARLMEEGTILKPGEQKEYTVKASVPLNVGEVSEAFRLVSVDGERTYNENVQVSINVASSDKPIIVITDTGAGYLRVRSEPSLNSEEVTRVSPGQRFLVEAEENGFTKIIVEEGVSGWVASRYTRKL